MPGMDGFSNSKQSDITQRTQISANRSTVPIQGSSQLLNRPKSAIFPYSLKQLVTTRRHHFQEGCYRLKCNGHNWFGQVSVQYIFKVSVKFLEEFRLRLDLQIG